MKSIFANKMPKNFHDTSFWGGEVLVNLCNEFRLTTQDWTASSACLNVIVLCGVETEGKSMQRISTGLPHPKKPRMSKLSVRAMLVSFSLQMSSAPRVFPTWSDGGSRFGTSEAADSWCEVRNVPRQMDSAPWQSSLTCSTFRQGVLGENIDPGRGTSSLRSSSRSMWVPPLPYYE